MTMKSFLDENLYVGVRRGVEFFHFGDGCIVDYFSSTIGYLDRTEMSLVAKCDGSHHIHEIINSFPMNAIDRSTSSMALDRLFKKGVIVFRQQPFDVSLVFHGVPGLFFPKELAIELTDTCNYQCPFCYKNASLNGNYITDEIIDKIDEVIRGKTTNILLTGGEPTLHPHFEDYIKRFSEHYKMRLITNGSIFFHFDPEVLRKLSMVQFSIYGCDNEEYNGTTGSPNGFSSLCRSVEFAQKYGISSVGSVTLSDKTCDHIEKFVQCAISLNLQTLRIGVADVFGRGEYLRQNSSVFLDQRNDILDYVSELKRKYRSKIFIEIPNINVRHINDHYDLIKGVYRNSLQCGCGSEFLAVSCSGAIRPCQMLPEDIFSFQGDNVLNEHIYGDFHIEQLCVAANCYCVDNSVCNANFFPCEALEVLVNQIKEGPH